MQCLITPIQFEIVRLLSHEGQALTLCWEADGEKVRVEIDSEHFLEADPEDIKIITPENAHLNVMVVGSDGDEDFSWSVESDGKTVLAICNTELDDLFTLNLSPLSKQGEDKVEIEDYREETPDEMLTQEHIQTLVSRLDKLENILPISREAKRYLLEEELPVAVLNYLTGEWDVNESVFVPKVWVKYDA